MTAYVCPIDTCRRTLTVETVVDREPATVPADPAPTCCGVPMKEHPETTMVLAAPAQRDEVRVGFRCRCGIEYRVPNGTPVLDVHCPSCDRTPPNCLPLGQWIMRGLADDAPEGIVR